MRAHPLEVSAPAGKKMKYLQPRFPQIGPAGDGPRAIFCAQSGMGKTSAAMVFIKEYLRIVERVHLISSTLHLDKGYEEIMGMIKKKYKEEDIDIDDPEENPFHEELTSLKTIMAGMVKRTREAQEQGDSYAPLTLILVDDLMSGSGPSQGYRYNDDILKLFHLAPQWRRLSPSDPVIYHAESISAPPGHSPGNMGCSNNSMATSA